MLEVLEKWGARAPRFVLGIGVLALFAKAFLLSKKSSDIPVYFRFCDFKAFRLPLIDPIWKIEV